ncbi:alpha/beta fold hydrolase [Micromonospora sp. NPDC049171]|uniref:thioesterase II family protein n=1 Tax=Micromonospora sp. NPDC049171 TaxID=3155770 RepID=UPI0033C2B6E5
MTGRDQAERERWIRRFHPAPGATRLLCLPHAGGSSSFFFPLATAVAGKLNVQAVQYPGRQDRRSEPPLTSIDALADALFHVLDPDDDSPLAIFGHSMGAVVGFELARRLSAAGRPPTALFASGRGSPLLSSGGTVHTLGDAGLLAELRRLNGAELAPLEDQEILQMIIPALRADFRAVETYRPAAAPPLTCPVIAMVGDADPRVTVAQADAWSETTDGRFELLVHPGGHFYLAARKEAVVAQILERLRAEALA